MRGFLACVILWFIGSVQGWGTPVISEFLASNDSELADEDGEFSDWIEIYNPDAVAVNMEGWYLTDNADNAEKWVFPSVTIPAGEYLVVFASNKNRSVAGSELHVNFKLSSGGSYLALVMPDGVSKISEFDPFPIQSTDVSYGLPSEASLDLYAYLTEPSPGGVNVGGVVNPGPIISEVTENPGEIGEDQNLLITANVQLRDELVTSVGLRYRVGYASEVSVPMVDDGSGGDALVGDGVYSAIIPASAASAGEMLRWTVVATDAGLKQSRMPIQLDGSGKSQSPEYYGTVVSSSIPGALTVLQWFTEDVAGSRNRTGARAAVFYAGRFYDNIYVRQRGGYTNSGSQKFDFNKGFPFYVNANLPSVGEINMNGGGSDSSYVRQTLGFDFHRLSGGAGSEAFPVQMRLNGSFDRVGSLVEQVDEDYVKRFGYDDDGGELFKFTQRSDLKPSFNDVTTGIEKKTGDETDLSSLQSLIDDLRQGTSNARVTSFYDNLDVAQFLNYMAVRCVHQQGDDVRKNFYAYKDTAGDGRWRVFPWDLDWTFGIVGGHGADRVEHPFFGIQAFPTNDGANQWNRLYDVAFEDLAMQRMYLRRIRTLMDIHMKPSSTGSWFEPRVDEIFNSMAGLPGPSSSGYSSLRNTEIPERRGDLFTELTVSITGMDVVIPAAQPVDPDVVIDEVDYSPASHDQDQEYIRLTNNESTEIDISGWSISGGVTYTFPAGTVIPRNGEIYVSPDLTKFVTRSVSPTGGERRLVTGPYLGHLSSFGEELILKDDAGGLVHTFSYPGSPSAAQQYLVVSEFLYYPVSNSSAEFIEITNISDSVTVDLTGVHFSDGVDFDFTGSAVTSLSPGEMVLVVRDQTAFESVFGTGVSSRIAGVFTNGSGLNNGGERIKLEDVTNSTIHEFTYLDELPWPRAVGASLVLLTPETRPDHNNPANWKVSIAAEGHPGGGGALFAAWLAARGQIDPLADPDGDGWSELLTYGLGLDLAGDEFVHKGYVDTYSVFDVEGRYLTLETTVRKLSDQLVIPQVSSHLADDWRDAVLGTDVILVSDVDHEDGTRKLKYRSTQVVVPGGRQFMRVLVRSR